MTARLRYLRDLITNSYWFLPALITLAAIALSVVTQAIDHRFMLDGLDDSAWVRSLIYAGGPDGAREVLSTIAGSMITVAGVVFSITIVALTLASSQFGPRVLTNFMRDRGNKVVLGIFIATFVYSLLVLRTIRSGDEAGSAVVPHISVTIALVLALASLSVLIYFIHHVATAIQAPNLIAAIAEDLHMGIVGLVPADAEPPANEAQPISTVLPSEFERDAAPVRVARTGYIDVVDAQGLVELAEEHGLLVRLENRPGHFIVKGSALAHVSPASALDADLARQIAGACVIGPRRTSIQDVEFPINQLVEVAVRALSPGINDPFTAITCIDQLGAGLCDLAPRPFPPTCWFGRDGTPRLVIARPITFPGVVASAFDQIRQNAAHHAAVHIRLLESIGRIVERASGRSRLEPLLAQADLILERSEADVPTEADREAIRERYAAVRAAADRKQRDGDGSRP